MANSGPNTNGCQFFLTCTKCDWLDGKHGEMCGWCVFVSLSLSLSLCISDPAYGVLAVVFGKVLDPGSLMVLRKVISQTTSHSPSHANSMSLNLFLLLANICYGAHSWYCRLRMSSPIRKLDGQSSLCWSLSAASYEVSEGIRPMSTLMSTCDKPTDEFYIKVEANFLSWKFCPHPEH